jgi:hypothetical protein
LIGKQLIEPHPRQKRLRKTISDAPRERESLSSPSEKNFSLGGWVDTALSIRAIPPRQEGRMRYRHETWGGMRWT